MPIGYKIALFGTGHVRNIAYAGMAAITYCETKNEKAENSAFNIDILKLAEPVDYTSLVKAYKKVQRKYYPEQDVYVSNKSNGV